jgi:hypothetical protein
MDKIENILIKTYSVRTMLLCFLVGVSLFTFLYLIYVVYLQNIQINTQQIQIETLLMQTKLLTQNLNNMALALKARDEELLALLDTIKQIQLEPPLIEAQNAMAPFYLKTASVVIVGVIVLGFIVIACPNLFNKVEMPSYIKKFMQDNIYFLQEKKSSFVLKEDDVCEILVTLVNEKSIDVTIKDPIHTNFMPIIDYIKTLKNDKIGMDLITSVSSSTGESNCSVNSLIPVTDVVTSTLNSIATAPVYQTTVAAIDSFSGCC